MQFTNNFSGTKLTNYPRSLGSIEQKFVNTTRTGAGLKVKYCLRVSYS